MKTYGRINNLVDEPSPYFMGKWHTDARLYEFVDGTCSGSHFRTKINTDTEIAIDDILIGPHDHRVEMKITRDGETFEYSARMHEQVLRIFGSYGDHTVMVDERRPDLSPEEILAIQSIPDRTLREIMLCTITRPLPSYEVATR
ncbi:MAG: hypothetical protein KKD18_00495 [Nanoarchaeota archaeon]|nr:hypothetical protein [Nanoarchaeota archaeon]MBU0976878.1 hypothetical protein [Nanoarchaeota archaeon]